MLDFRRTLWALWLGAAVVGMLGHTPVVLAQIAVSANHNKLMLVNGVASAEASIGHWSQDVAFTPDHQYMLVQNMVEKDILSCTLDGEKLADTGQRLKMQGVLLPFARQRSRSSGT